MLLQICDLELMFQYIRVQANRLGDHTPTELQVVVWVAVNVLATLVIFVSGFVAYPVSHVYSISSSY